MKCWDFRSYDLKNDLQFLDNAREHIGEPYIRERLVNRLEWHMVGMPPFKRPGDKDTLFLKFLENLSIGEN